ncbi:MAG: aldo/keto reductase [Rhodocyclaceae bacterium]|nr:aldo/keto reductase [Rhodocyclaceae bacterium]
MNLEHSRLALGTVQFGLSYGIANRTGQVSESEAKAMLAVASRSGINLLDTAIAYGSSEVCLGTAGVAGFRIVTKLPSFQQSCSDDEAAEWVRRQVEESLSRLKTDSLYGVLVHQPNQLLGINGKAILGALQNLKSCGVLQKWGVSIYAPAELETLMPMFGPDIVQAPFNLLDRRLHTSGWLRRLRDHGVEVHVRSAFLQGLLLMRGNDISAKFSPWAGLFAKWQDWLKDSNVSALNACIRFPMSFPEIDKVVVGADSAEQLRQIVAAAAAPTVGAFPEIECEDEQLLHPSQWSQL